jgi:hypothetical protein
MSSLNPFGKVVYVCDDVLRDPASGKVHFFGLFEDVIPPSNVGYPFRLGRMCVVAQLTGGAGQVPFHVEVVEGATQRLVRRAGPFSLTCASHHQVVTALVRIQNCLFPSAGTYFVELYVSGQFLDDRRLHLH